MLLCTSCQKDLKTPNIIFILADDMGYSDLGYQGSLIETPNLDFLFNRGLTFPNFYNAGTCTASRAALLTGLYPHRVGCGSNGFDYGLKAFTGSMSASARTLPSMFRENNYRSYFSGKWHLGWKEELRPINRGFDQAFQMGPAGMGGTYFHPFINRRHSYPFLNDTAAAYDSTAFYTTDAFTDYAIAFLEDHDQNYKDLPFFLYLPFNAPHFPLQAKPKDILKYKDRFSKGYAEVLSHKPNIKDKPLLHQSLREQWEALSPNEKNQEAQKMAVYAAQMDCMDQNIGKLMKFLTDHDLDEETLIFFVSDNGSNNNLLGPKDNSDSVEIGNNKSWTSYGQAWATISNYPYKYFKSSTHEGGIKAPLVIYNEKLGSGNNGFIAHLIDIFPTLEEIVSGAPILQPNKFDGQSFAKLLYHPTEKVDSKRTLYWETYGNRAIRKGTWKAVSRNDSHDKSWELYEIERDSTEIHDIAMRHPIILDSLIRDYKEWAVELEILPKSVRDSIYEAKTH